MTHAAEQAKQTGSTYGDKSGSAVTGMQIETFDVHVTIPKFEITEA